MKCLNSPYFFFIPESFSYKNHPIYKVDVIGVIVRVTENSKSFIYAGSEISNHTTTGSKI